MTEEAINVLKENEPAPAEADTSSKNNNLQLNDTAKLKICQDVIDKIAKCSSDAWARGYCQAAMQKSGRLKNDNNQYISGFTDKFIYDGTEGVEVLVDLENKNSHI